MTRADTTTAVLSTAAQIECLLQQGLEPTHLTIRDESDAHAGHASGGGKRHFRLRIVSMSFRGLKPLQRHRLVNNLLAPLFQTDLHALAMETLTPEEFTLRNLRN